MIIESNFYSKIFAVGILCRANKEKKILFWHFSDSGVNVKTMDFVYKESGWEQKIKQFIISNFLHI